MLFMVMHKMTPELEKGVPPSDELIHKMGQLISEAQANGTLHNAAGLHPGSRRARLKCAAGKCSKIDGPLKGENELIASFVILKVPSMDSALDWASRIGEALGDGEVDVGPVVEPWDLGKMAKPANPPLRVMAMTKAGAAFEAGAPPAPASKKKMDAVIQSMKEAGVFLAAETLASSSHGARLRTDAGKRTWTDGPFTETKELISGFTMLHLPALEDARTWAERYADILGDIEVDVREVMES